MRLSHPEEYQEQVLARSRLRCHLCGLPCSSSRQLIEHQRSQHPLGRPFQCPVCGDSFIQSHALINHQRRHVRQSRYACRDCPHTSRSLAQLLAHRRAHALPRPPLPAPPAATPAAAEEPQQTPASSLQCPQCFITFQDLQTSQQHMRLQHPALYWQQLRGRTVFACRRCDRTFPSSRQLSAHQRAHLQGQEAEDEEREAELRKSAPDAQPPSPCPRVLSEQHKCPYCNFLFRDAKTKLRHMNAKHPPGCPPPPPLLLTATDSGGEGEGEEKAVMAVQIKKEEEEELEKCEEDNPCAAPGPTLDGHSRLLNGGTEGDEDEGGVVKVRIKVDPGEEEGEERVPSPSPPPACECALCGKGFEQMVAVARQRRRGRRRDHPTLLGPRGHVCRHCGQLCHSREELQQHQRLHTDERPYHCQHCGNTFKKASGLQRHKSVHSQLLHTVTAPTPAAPSLQRRVTTSTSQTDCECD
ncbi:zinc finger protein 497-like [Megalops cyprinoides]|uniref:zinc finger protein 497-like n=1 Tax=Megalops cyprinoides TaxID=118141 RepID=UPI0018643D18|nr:zinc finger protein 497-like [Megalops cyprinoides]